MKDDDEGDYEWLRRTLRNRARRNFARKGFAGMAGGAGTSVLASWVAAVVANGGSVSAARQATVGTLLAGLQTDGVWTKLDRLWIFAAENSQSALTDMSSAHTLAAVVAAPTFTIDRGYAGNGSTSYVNTTFNPATQGTNYKLNTASVHCWDNSNRAGANLVQIGSDNGTDYITIATFGLGSTTLLNINELAAGNTGASANSIGFFSLNRSAAAAIQSYQNGASIGSGTTSASVIPSFAVFVGARNSSGTAGLFSTDQMSAAALGGSLSAGETLLFYNRLRTYMTAVGVP